MKLIINRSQHDQKGMLGGHKGVNFTLRYRLVLTEEERQLVERYRLNGHTITTRTFQGREIPGTSIADMVQGQSSIVTDVTHLIREENVIKNACDELPVLFDICRSFGGDEVIDYPRKKEDRAEAVTLDE